MMTIRLLLVLGLLAVLTPAAHAGTWPWIWGGSPQGLICNVTPFSLAFCDTGASADPGPTGTPYIQVTLSASDNCISGEEPHLFVAVGAQFCSFPVLLRTWLQGIQQPYFDEYFGLIQADGMKANVQSYLFIGGLPYTYWSGNRISDCYDDAVRDNIPGGTPC